MGKQLVNNDHGKQKIAIVVPIFNEQASIHILFERLLAIAHSTQEISWTYVFVDDGSSDESQSILERLCDDDPSVTVILFTKNFGKEVALTAGVLEAIDYDAVITIDADLQHPPELIPEFIEHWRKGSLIVAAKRRSGKQETLTRRIASFLFHKIMKVLSETNMERGLTDFGLYDAIIVREFSRLTERRRIFRGMINWLGYQAKIVEFIADERHDGEARYSFGSLFSLAVYSLFSYSFAPLHFISYLGALISVSAGGIMLWGVSTFLFSGSWGFTPIAAVLLANTFLIGLVLISLGIIAVYLGAIHNEAINRPLFVVKRKINALSDRS